MALPQTLRLAIRLTAPYLEPAVLARGRVVRDPPGTASALPAAVLRAAAPGLTGLWQVGRRNDVDRVRRIQLDAACMLGRSSSGDLKIIVRTAGVLVSNRSSNR